MERSLTVLLPVRNAQSTLATTVLEILEVVSELTRRFELIILDDGSSDATSEVAHELTHCYPQVRALCHARSLGLDTLIGVGLASSMGELILLRDAAGSPPAEGIRRWWQALQGAETTATARRAGNGHGRSARFSRHLGHQAGYRLMERRANPLRGSSRPAAPNYLSRQKDLV